MTSKVGDPRVRESLCRALIELSYEQGLAEVTVESLCRRAGVEPKVFAREFGDIDGCFCATYDQELDLLLGEFAEAISRVSGWRARLRAVAYAFYRWLAAYPARTHLMVTEIRSASEAARLIQWRGIQQIIDLIDEGRAALPDPDRITKATAESIAGGILTQIYAAVPAGDLPPAAEIVPQMLYTAVLPYLGPEAAAEELVAPPPVADTLNTR